MTKNEKISAPLKRTYASRRKREYANKRNAEKRRAADDRPAEVAA